MPRRRTQPKIEVPSKLSSAQFDYAWKWFNFHADQRTKMFNFMLIIFGFLVAAIANSYEKTTGLSIWVCIFGTLLAMIFARLDMRNQQLLSWAEDILIKLEADELYKDFKVWERKSEKTDMQGGILWRQKLEEIKWKQKNRNDPFKIREHSRGLWTGKHRYMLRGIAYLFALGFVATGVWLKFFYHIAVPIIAGGE